ncbi:hypothetical protein EDD21DRAFT_186135 [Dissophora ornata]|nr:hypothetical protein EDD21DRAFT_186135 [Dissophora ornata]
MEWTLLWEMQSNNSFLIKYSHTRLWETAKKTYGENVKKKPDIKREAVDVVKKGLRATENAQTSSPRHCMERAADMLATDFEIAREDLSNKYVSERLAKMSRKHGVNFVDVLRREVLSQYYDLFWIDLERNSEQPAKGAYKEDEEEEAVADDEEDASGTEAEGDGAEAVQTSTRMKKELRSCTATLAQIVRPDMKDQQIRIEGLLERKQEDLSDFMEELAIAAFKITLEVSHGVLHSQTHTLDLKHFFPPSFKIRDSYFAEPDYWVFFREDTSSRWRRVFLVQKIPLLRLPVRIKTGSHVSQPSTQLDPPSLMSRHHPISPTPLADS